MRQFALLLSGLLLFGCTESEAFVGREPVSLPAEAQSALGYLDVRGSVVVSWCAAVLVAPQLVLTAAHCVRDVDVSRISFGLGRITPAGPELGPYRVRAVELHPDILPNSGPWQHNVAALFLELPVNDVRPARLGQEAQPSGRLTSVTYEYVPRGQSGERRVWAGRAQGAHEPITVVPTEGLPNCHVDTGTGVIDADDNVLGFVSTGFKEPAPDQGRGGVYDTMPGCYQTYRIAGVTQNRVFIDRAITQAAAGPAVVP